jgi:hypothetical protein
MSMSYQLLCCEKTLFSAQLIPVLATWNICSKKEGLISSVIPRIDPYLMVREIMRLLSVQLYFPYTIVGVE